MNAKVKTEVKVEVQGPTPAELITKYGNKSSAIRALAAEGHERKVIAKMLGLRYQHVRNVLITPIKKAKVVVQAPAEGQK